jgi:hypothetical protein
MTDPMSRPVWLLSSGLWSLAWKGCVDGGGRDADGSVQIARAQAAMSVLCPLFSVLCL